MNQASEWRIELAREIAACYAPQPGVRMVAIAVEQCACPSGRAWRSPHSQLDHFPRHSHNTNRYSLAKIEFQPLRPLRPLR